MSLDTQGADRGAFGRYVPAQGTGAPGSVRPASSSCVQSESFCSGVGSPAVFGSCVAVGLRAPVEIKGRFMDSHRTQTVESARSSLDALVRASKIPGMQYLVVDRSKTVFEFNGGLADIAARRAMTAETTLMAYSMSKTITAAAVLQLAEKGKIGLDDSIDRFLDPRPYGRNVSVRHLLSHTSGIPNPIPLAWVHPVAPHERFDDAARAAELRKHGRLSFAPGAKYAYSNIGYWLLGSIVERVSREPFTSYVTGHVLRLLGIAPQDLGYTIVNPATHAKGYLEKFSLMNLLKGWLIDRALIGNYEGRWLEIHGHYLNGPAFGGLVGTTRGFGKFLQDQLRAQSGLFGDATRSLLYAQQRTNDGMAIAMTLGWHIGSIGGVRFFYKEGGGGGFHSMMRLYPEVGIATVVMANATNFAVRRCLDTSDRPFLPVDLGR